MAGKHTELLTVLKELLESEVLQVFLTTDATHKYNLSNADAAFRVLYEITHGEWRNKLKYDSEGLDKMTGSQAADAYRNYIFEVLETEGLDLDR
jgi:hypothetical protein